MAISDNVKVVLAILAVVGTGSGIFVATMTTTFNLILPDGTERDNVILSQDNFTHLKENVGIFTVYQPQATHGQGNIGYCPIAKLIHEHEDGYNNIKVGNSTVYVATIPPAWCNSELHPSKSTTIKENITITDNVTAKVPEFGLIAGLVLVIAIVSIIAITAKVNIRFRP